MNYMESNNSSPQNRRSWTNFLIHPRYQLRFAATLAVTAVLTMMLVFGVILVTAKSNYNLLSSMGSEGALIRSQLHVQLMQLFTLMGILGFFFVLSLTAIGIILSHRTAGPLYQYKKVFDAIIAGNPKSRIHCRPRDDFKEVAESFNRMMDKMAP